MVLNILILVVGALLAGYLLGKQQGRIQGYEEGKAAMPLLLRQTSLEKGYCVLCSEISTVAEISYCINPESSIHNNPEGG
ncbi:MAG TPA: hypothetical protein VGL27_12470 [Negativicutes bacterium]